MEELPEVGKSTLLDSKFKFVGFMHINHPEAGRIQVTFFQKIPDVKVTVAGEELNDYVLCFSNVTRSEERKFKKQLKKDLGNVAESEEVVPYVHRGIEGSTYERFKELMAKAFPKTSITWQ